MAHKRPFCPTRRERAACQRISQVSTLPRERRSEKGAHCGPHACRADVTVDDAPSEALSWAGSRVSCRCPASRACSGAFLLSTGGCIPQRYLAAGRPEQLLALDVGAPAMEPPSAAWRDGLPKSAQWHGRARWRVQLARRTPHIRAAEQLADRRCREPADTRHRTQQEWGQFAYPRMRHIPA